MALLIAYVILAIIILLCVRKRKTETDNPLDKKTSIALKGIFCILIIFHHLFQYIFNGKNWFLTFCNEKLGGIGVGVFFFLSAFGLVVSYKKKGKEYIKKILTKNIPTLYLTYVVTNLIYFLVFNLGNMAAEEAVLKILGFTFLYGFKTINFAAWYMTVIIVFYLLFCIIYWIFGENLKKTAIIFTVITLVYNIIVFVCEIFVLKQLYLYDRSITCFAFGILYATFYKQINHHLSKNFYEYILYSLSVVLFGVITIEDISAIGVCLLIMTLLQKYNLSNVLLDFIGKISFYVYLLHGLFIRSFIEINKNQYFFVYVVLAATIAASYIYYLVRNLFFKLFTIRKSNKKAA